MKKKKALLITNPLSGINRKRISASEIMKKLKSAGYDFTVKATKGPNDATKIVENDLVKLQVLENKIKERIIGQDEAVVAVSKAIRRGRVGLKDEKRLSEISFSVSKNLKKLVKTPIKKFIKLLIIN